MNKFLIRLSWLIKKDYQKTLEEISKKNKISKRRLSKDIKQSFYKYGSDYQDYKIFNFVCLDESKKSTFLTYELNKYYINTYNNNKKEIIIPNKVKLTNLKDITQHEELAILNEYTNIFKFLVLNNEIVSCILKIKIKSKEIYAPINLDTGIIDYPGVDLTKKVYERNTKNKEEIFWFRIPKWPRIKRYVEKNAQYFEDYKYLELNVVLDNEKGPCLISCNVPSYQLYQIPIKNKKDEGIKYLIEKKEVNK